jgi:hypothetical protein
MDTNILDMGGIMAGIDAIPAAIVAGPELSDMAIEFYNSASTAVSNGWDNLNGAIIQWQAGDMEGFQNASDILNGFINGLGPGPSMGLSGWGTWGYLGGIDVGCVLNQCWNSSAPGILPFVQ